MKLNNTQYFYTLIFTGYCVGLLYSEIMDNTMSWAGYLISTIPLLIAASTLGVLAKRRVERLENGDNSIAIDPAKVDPEVLEIVRSRS